LTKQKHIRLQKGIHATHITSQQKKLPVQQGEVLNGQEGRKKKKNGTNVYLRVHVVPTLVFS
jgi:hypothetical protein